MPAEPFPYNRVQLEGNLGQDPEIRHTTGGTIIAEISLAVYDGKDQNGEPKKAWPTVKAFNEVARVIGAMAKGDRLRVKEGKISQESWVDRATGGKRSKLVIIAWEVEKVEREPKDASRTESWANKELMELPRSHPDRPQSKSEKDREAYDEIPF